MRAIILINQGGGTAKGDANIGPMVEEAIRAAGIEGEVELLDGAGVAKRAQEAVKQKVPLVIAGGGDGSISAVSGAVAGSETCLGILPLGTLNHLARDLNIPFDIGDAAAIIGAGHERRIDVAELSLSLSVVRRLSKSEASPLRCKGKAIQSWIARVADASDGSANEG